jgi:hypothetical protein
MLPPRPASGLNISALSSLSMCVVSASTLMASWIRRSACSSPLLRVSSLLSDWVLFPTVIGVGFRRATPGAILQHLNPNLKGLPNYIASGGMSSAISPDSKTLLVLAAGYNSLDDSSGNLVARPRSSMFSSTTLLTDRQNKFRSSPYPTPMSGSLSSRRDYISMWPAASTSTSSTGLFGQDCKDRFRCRSDGTALTCDKIGGSSTQGGSSFDF